MRDSSCARRWWRWRRRHCVLRWHTLVLLLVYAPWVFHVHHISTHLVHPWVKGCRKHPFKGANWRYLDIVR